ncbi:MAG TPA: nucleotidyltransferase [Conexibacter sp.]|nr:nucleotidyltransferase [Conexibacter sp.]
MDERRHFDEIVGALRVAVPALREAQVPFMLGGSMAVWAYGGPEPTNDLDLMLRPQDAERALAALAAVGMRTEHPPEEWLVKAWHGEVLVDLIYGPRGMPIDDEVLARSTVRNLSALRVNVMALEDVLTTKLLSLDEHQLDLSWLLQIARAVREQVDWAQLRTRTAGSPYAAAFFTLVERLEIAPAAAGGAARPVRIAPASGAGGAR